LPEDPQNAKNTKTTEGGAEPATGNLRPPPPTADAVAVALEKDPTTGAAPKVVASGRGRIAEQILEIAFANGVRVREDADMAQLLSAIEVESDIPLEAFAAVAEILVYVYRANGDIGPDGIPASLDPTTWQAMSEAAADGPHQPRKDDA